MNPKASEFFPSLQNNLYQGVTILLHVSPLELTTPLVKELSEEFETEAPKSNLPPEPVLPLEVPSPSDLDLPLGTQCSLEDQMPHGSQTQLPSKQVFSEEETGQPSETLRTSQASDRPVRDPETPRPSGTESKGKL